MAINKKLITFAKKEGFLGATNGIGNASAAVNGYWNNIPSYSIVFIKETGEIWHNGVYYGKPIDTQINAAVTGTSSGLVFRLASNGRYYYRPFYFWGNTVDGSDPTIDGDLIVNSNWVYGQGEISYKNGDDRYRFFTLTHGNSSDDVTIPGGNLQVSNGNFTVSSLTGGQGFSVTSLGVVVAKDSISGSKLLNTPLYFNVDYSLGKTWTSIKQFDSSKTSVSLATTMPAIINIQAHSQNAAWQPWIAGGDSDSGSSWGIGLSGDNFYIGRVSKDQSTDALTNYWKFDSSGNFILTGNLSNGTYEYTLPSSSGTLALVSQLPTTDDLELLFSTSLANLTGRVISLEDWIKNPYYDSITVEELNVVKVINGTSSNSEKLGGQVASYYAVAGDLTNAVSRIGALELTISNLGAASTYEVSTVVTADENKLITSGAVFTAISNSLTAIMHFRGVSSTEITNLGTETATVNNSSFSPIIGDVVLYDGLEFVWDSTKWIQLGDEASFALKTIQIVAGTGLSGGGAISANVTISLSSETQNSLALANTAIQSSDLVQYVNDIEVYGEGNYLASVSKNGNKLTFVSSTLPTTIDLVNVVNADDLQAIEALAGTGFLKRTAENTWAFDTTTYIKESDLIPLISGINNNTSRIVSLEDFIINPHFDSVEAFELNTQKLNLGGYVLSYESSVLISNGIEVFSNLSTSGNNLSITVGGKTRTVEVGYASSTTKATNLAGGAKGSIPYQSATNTTTYLAVGTEGQVLKVGSSGTPIWGDDNNSNTWRSIYINNTSSVGSDVNTKAINYVAGNGITLELIHAGTGESYSGSESYFNLVVTNSGVRSIIKSGNNLTVDTNGTITNILVPFATKAEQDASGNVITDYYETKENTLNIESTLASGLATLSARIVSLEDWISVPKVEELFAGSICVDTQIILGGLTLRSDGSKLYIGDTGVYLEVRNGDIYTNAGIFMNTTN